MDFYDVIRKRRSIRGYTDQPISEQVLERLGVAVSLAPSACNRQPWLFRVVRNPAIREKIGGCYNQPWLKQAPAIVVAMGNLDECWKRFDGTPSVDIDMGIAMEHLVLAAAAEGLGTCWICAYDRVRMDQALGIMAPWTVLAISPLGYPAVEPNTLKRKTVSEVFAVID